MGGCRCSYKSCPNTTKSAGSLHFFHYPVNYPERCLQWMQNSQKLEYNKLTKCQLRNKAICEQHFEEKCFANSFHARLVHFAVPTLDGNSITQNDIDKQMNDVEILPASTDGTLYVVNPSILKSNVTSVETYTYTDGDFIPTEHVNKNPNETTFEIIKNEDSQLKPDVVNLLNYVIKVDNQQEPHETIFISQQNDIILNASAEPTQELLTINSNEIASKTDQGIVEIVNVDNVIDQVQNTILQEVFTEKSLIVTDKYLKQIEKNSKEIANLKHLIRLNKRAKRRKYSKLLLRNSLKRHLPKSLYAAVNLHLSKKRNHFSTDEEDFLKTVQAVSPELYGIMVAKWNWNLPSTETIKNFI